MLILLPDVFGGFSFHQVYKQFPDEPIWRALAATFTHVQWTGASVWDFILPSFVFLVGVAMPFSAAARRRRGDSERQTHLHVWLRSATLFLLGMMMDLPRRTYVEEFWPLALLAVGLPVGEWLGRAPGFSDARPRNRLGLVWWLAILIPSAIYLYAKLYDLGNYEFTHVFILLAFTSGWAFLLVGKPMRAQLLTAFAILVLYWILFAQYPTPGSWLDPATVGVRPGDEVFEGFFAHWNKNTNVGAAFDVWFLNLLPRAEQFRFQANGVQTLNFLPTISTMIFGIMAGEFLTRRWPASRASAVLVAVGVAGVVVGLGAGRGICPIVKSIWTPSWVLFSGGVAAIVLGVCHGLCGVRGARRWLFPLEVLGTNSILLYTLASRYRWRFLSIPEKLGFAQMFAGPYLLLWESVLFIVMLWTVAYVLLRLRIFVRI